MKADELKPFHYKTFTLEELRNYFNQKPASMRVQLFRLCKNKKLVRLKQNLYTFPDFHPNVFVIGQQMVSPSYYSLESVLSWNGIIPEGAATYTLITSKRPSGTITNLAHSVIAISRPNSFLAWNKGKTVLGWQHRKRLCLIIFTLIQKNLRRILLAGRRKDLMGFQGLNWKQMRQWASKIRDEKLNILVDSLKSYASSSEYQAHK